MLGEEGGALHHAPELCAVLAFYRSAISAPQDKTAYLQSGCGSAPSHGSQLPPPLTCVVVPAADGQAIARLNMLNLAFASQLPPQACVLVSITWPPQLGHLQGRHGHGSRGREGGGGGARRAEANGST